MKMLSLVFVEDSVQLFIGSQDVSLRDPRPAV
jgi:hypothetical protein